MKRPNKILRGFRLHPSLNDLLVKQAKKQKVTQTWLLENALREKLAVK